MVPNTIVISFDEYTTLMNNLAETQRLYNDAIQKQKQVLIQTEKHIFNHNGQGATAIRHIEIDKKYVNIEDVITQVKRETEIPFIETIKQMKFSYNKDMKELETRLETVNNILIKKDNDLKQLNEIHNKSVQDSNELLKAIQTELSVQKSFHVDQLQKLTNGYEIRINQQADTISELNTKLEEMTIKFNLANHQLNKSNNELLTIKQNKFNLKKWKEYLQRLFRF